MSSNALMHTYILHIALPIIGSHLILNDFNLHINCYECKLEWLLSNVYTRSTRGLANTYVVETQAQNANNA